jgi:phosphogluconate dehydratase
MDSKSKIWLAQAQKPNIGIVTAYNDMLSAHQPYEGYPELIRQAAPKAGATAQVAGAVPAMCDGVTQGRPGMELSLFSRDVIAQATAVALSHDAFDAALCLGICDKIVPGLLIGALAFGHLPVIFVPAGADGFRFVEQRKRLYANVMRRAKRPKKNCWQQKARLITAPVLVRSTVRLTVIRCCWKRWACIYRVLLSYILPARCVML